MWHDPAPLPEGLPTVDSFDAAMLPNPSRGWIMDVDELMLIPPDFSAVGASTVADPPVARKMGIHPKRHVDWLVVPKLWAAVVTRPAVLTSFATRE
jgi:putative DNA primase/helicase